jgi:hypothetical protein
MSTEKSLERCRVDRFDLVLLHNPDSVGYTSDAVWKGMERLQEAGLSELIGVAHGPANGFTLDLILCIERFGPLLDWAMIILNPLEPWPGSLCLPAALQQDVRVLTRVVDHGGLFHGDVKPGHQFGDHDHRSFRPAGWVETGTAKIERMWDVADKHGLTLLQFAAIWNLSHPGVRSVVPTFIEESGPGCKPILTKIDEIAQLPEVVLTESEREHIARLGDNKGCMELKGASRAHVGEPVADRWGVSTELEAVGTRWGIDPGRDLACVH